MTTVAVAIQGEAGSFSHAAALQALGPDIRLVPCPSFEEVFRAVEAGDAARGAVPIENSLAGSVHENYDLLGARTLHVVAETQVRVRHCLIARPGTERAAIRRVASHPVALAQCRKFFANHTDVVPVPAYDTAGSVRDLMAGRVAADAAIATSLVFTLPNAPGSLHRALGVFAARGLDLTKIESRPLAGRPWEYAFYLDVVGDPRAGVAEALAELRGLARELRILGSYPGSDIPVAKG